MTIYEGKGSIIFCLSFDRSNEDNKFFIQSPKSRKLEQAALSRAWRNNSNLSDNFDRSSPVDIPHPKDIPLAPSRTSQDRTVILTNTRNIAALAAKKRNKAQTSLFNNENPQPRPLYRPGSDKNANERDAFLTPSRLDKHNKFFVTDNVFMPSNAPSEDSLSTITKHTTISDTALPPLRRVSDNGADRFNGNVRQWVPADPAMKRRKKKAENSYTQQVCILTVQ